MSGLQPPGNFSSAQLRLHTVQTGERFGRIFLARYPDPLGFGKTKSRFSDPRRAKPENRFGVLYLGSTFEVCFLEALLRDRRNGLTGPFILDERELQERLFVTIAVQVGMRVVDLRGSNAVAMGVPAGVKGDFKQGLGQTWSLAFYRHPSAPDGIIYPSRINGQTNLAVYDRAVLKLKAVHSTPLIKAPDLGPCLNALDIGIGP